MIFRHDIMSTAPAPLRITQAVGACSSSEPQRSPMLSHGWDNSWPCWNECNYKQATGGVIGRRTQVVRIADVVP